MKTLEDLLGFDPESPDVQRARMLATNDRKLLQALVEIREEKLTQEQVARIMGISQPSVAAFESVSSNPKLSTIRRYAQAIGALIRHEVTSDEGQLKDSSIEHQWKTIHLRPSRENLSQKNVSVDVSIGAASFRFDDTKIRQASKSKRRDFALAA